MGRMPTSVERVHETPEALAGFAADYWDCFATPTGSLDRPAREWAARSLRGADVAGGAFSRLVWQGGLGLRLAARGTPGTLVGWTIGADTPSEFVLDADGRWMAARMHFAIAGNTVRWTTMLRLYGRAGRRIWAVAAPVHRTLAPRCLAAAH
jgi:Protein of unknown function (DUF2867)